MSDKPFVNRLVHAKDPTTGDPTGTPLYSGDEDRAKVYAESVDGVVLTPDESEAVVVAFQGKTKSVQ